MNNQNTIRNKKLLGGEVCLSGNASSQPAGEFLNKGVEMKEIPKEMTVTKLEVLVMPNGEVICLGKTLGRFKDFKECLEEVKKK